MAAGQQSMTQLKPLIVSSNGVPAYSMMGLGEARLLMTGEETGGRWWLGHFREDPGFVTPLHLHPQTDEQFYVLDGTLSLYVDGAWQDVTAGTLVIVPRMLPHAQGNFGDSSVTFLGSGNPAGFEQYFPAIDAMAKRGLTFRDPEFHKEMATLGPRCDIQLLGPTPGR